MKILVIRMSSIGDIVLTSPVVRSLKQAKPDAEIHFLVKPQFVPVVQHSPYINKIHVLQKPISATIKTLQAENFDFVIDLHKNLRSSYICFRLGKPSSSFPKENLRKWWSVRLKKPLPIRHIVNRYAVALQPLGVPLDGNGLDFFLAPGTEDAARTILQDHFRNLNPYAPAPVAVVLGATHGTKKWPVEHHAALINRLNLPVVVLGGKAEEPDAQALISQIQPPHLNAAGAYDLQTAAALMKQCQFVITHDTGLMHIAAAFGQKILSLWGNTLPEFGMTPYLTPYLAAEVKGLDCRPCSKIGFKQCPRGHFKCMRALQPENVFRQMGEHGILN
jgi:lipopolysaccharide heptosyltransferase II